MHKVFLQSTLKRKEIYFHFLTYILTWLPLVSDRHQVHTTVLVREIFRK